MRSGWLWPKRFAPFTLTALRFCCRIGVGVVVHQLYMINHALLADCGMLTPRLPRAPAIVAGD